MKRDGQQWQTIRLDGVTQSPAAAPTRQLPGNVTFRYVDTSEGYERPVPPIGELPELPTGPQIQLPRPTGPTGPTQPPRPTGPTQPPRPTGPTQPPRPTGPVQPPRPTPPPVVVIPPAGQLPVLNIQPPRGQTLGRGRCLGPQSRNYVTQLQEFIRRELLLYQNLMALAESGGRWRDTLRDAATRSYERARLLLAAHYSITRRLYWPASLNGPASLATFSRELYRLYQVAQELENDYAAGYRRSLDQCLGSLYLDLADDANIQAAQLNRILQVI